MQKFEAIVAPTITEMFEQQIQGMILSGRLKIGEKLPTERELAESMRVSKSIVHLGIKNLERQGFLTISPRHGVYVANYSETGNVETLLALLKYNGGRLDKASIASLLQVREALEGMAMRLLAEKHTDDQMLMLRMHIQDVRKAAERESDNTELLAELVYKFHLYICIKSGNNMIPLIMNGFKDVSIVFWRSWIDTMGIERTLDSLEASAKHIADGDGQAAIDLFCHNAEDYMLKI
jgi:GntR family transcriptional regulator, transcriptional repressor for pyruvate dehydrogenase complex